MKTRKLEMRSRDKLQDKRGKILPTVVLSGVLLGSPSESYAQGMQSVDDGKATMEVVQKETESEKVAVMPDGFKLPVGDGVTIEPDPDIDDDGVTVDTDIEGGDGKEKGEVEQEDAKKGLEVHGMVWGGSDVTPLLGSVLSDKPALILKVDVSHPKTGLGATVIRVDDFDKSMDSPASQATIIDLYLQKKMGKMSGILVGEYVSMDKMPGADSFTPIAGLSYDAGKGLTLDGRYMHSFQKGEDSDVIRLGLTKKLAKSLSVAMQGFYRSDLDKKFYGRVIVDVDLGGGFGAQLSCIAKDGKLTPTAGVMFRF